jgi:hypothetical protein
VSLESPVGSTMPTRGGESGSGTGVKGADFQGSTILSGRFEIVPRGLRYFRVASASTGLLFFVEGAGVVENPLFCHGDGRMTSRTSLVHLRVTINGERDEEKKLSALS